MIKKLILLSVLASTSACATIGDSLQLGASMGAISGGAATYAAHKATGATPVAEDVLLGAGIGLAAGLLTSYIVHKNVEEERQGFLVDQTEMHFGDLPPSPFILPKTNSRKGGN